MLISLFSLEPESYMKNSEIKINSLKDNYTIDLRQTGTVIHR